MGRSGRTIQRSSVSEHGLLPFRRHVDCARRLEISFQDVERAARVCLPQLVTDSLIVASALTSETAISTHHFSRVFHVAVEPEVSIARTRPGVIAHVHWHARRHGGLFPVMEADLLARPHSSGRAELALEATYRPPGGILGLVGDVLFGRIVARSTAAAFTDRLAQAMEEAVKDGRCGGWTSIDEAT